MICRDWNIAKSSISAVVTDNAANIVKSVRDTFGKVHLPCFAHTIQLIPGTAMDKTPLLSNVVNKVKRIVTYFKKSVKATDELRRLQLAEGKTEGTLLKLKQEDEARWNTMYYMLERFILMGPWVSSVLFNISGGQSMLQQQEIETLKEVMYLLKPFEQVTKELCTEDVTCSKVIPIVHCLTAAVEKNNPESEIGMVLQMNLLDRSKSSKVVVFILKI